MVLLVITLLSFGQVVTQTRIQLPGVTLAYCEERFRSPETQWAIPHLSLRLVFSCEWKD